MASDVCPPPPDGATAIERDPGEAREDVVEESARSDSLEVILERLAREWRATFDTIDTPILLVHADGRVVRLNRAAQRLADLPFDEILGRPVGEVGRGAPWVEMAALVRAIVERRESVSAHARDDQGRHWDVAANLLAAQPEDRASVIVTARDVSAIVRLQASLQRAEAMSAMGALVAGVAHQVRNPLFAISATLDAFEARFGSSAEHEPYVSALRREVARVSNLMRDLLEYGKPPKQELAAGDMGEALAGVLETIGRVALERSATVILRKRAPLPPLRLDWGRVGQAIQNVVENALHHSPGGGAVTVEARTSHDRGEEPWVEVSVADDGPGFSPGDLARVFQPFFSRRRGGTGLGLSIAQRIIEAHGGTLTAANRPDGGALVTLALPAIARGA